MKKLQKIVALVLSVLLVLSFAACGQKEAPETEAPTQAAPTEAATQPAPETEAPETAAPAEPVKIMAPRRL